jgi:ubiquinone/menaquinone biosynthesis C-methylase UbiE
MHEYDLIADWYTTDRGRSVGVAEALVNAGHRVVGLDSSSGMLALFRAHLPITPVVRGDARQCPFAAGEFDAAISWGMMFHLSRVDQSAVYESVSRALKASAPFLFTAAEIADSNDAGITGVMNGVTLRYYAVPSYRTLLAEHGLVLVDVHDDRGVSTYYLVRKAP